MLRQENSKVLLFHCRIFFPMPQLTPDCDRVVVLIIPPSDGMDYNPLYAVKLIQIVMEIRISEDYCRSDIYVVDFRNITLRHVTRTTPSVMKKYELCAVVSSTNNFCVINVSRA
jgi:hypothetical protein